MWSGSRGWPGLMNLMPTCINVIYTCSHRNGLFHLISAHPMSRVHVREEFYPQKTWIPDWEFPAWKTWTPEEFQQKPEPLWNWSLKNLNLWGILAWKTLPKPLRNSSIKNLNPWGMPASKTWTCEEFQTRILTLGEFQPQKYWCFRNCSLNC